MTTMQSLTPEQLTGEYVRQLREHYKLSRQQLAERAGFPTQTRILNIERKDSWKPGDREKLIAAFQAVEADPPTTKIGRRKGETGEERAARLQAALQSNGHAVDPVAPSLDASVQLEQTQPDAGVEYDEPSSSFFDAELDEMPSDLAVPVDNDVELPAELPVLTNSELAVWQRCRRKWWLAFYRKLALGAQDFTGPRAIGNRVHRALAAWYVPEGEERVDPRDALERAIVEDWTAISNQVHQHSAGDVEQTLSALSAQFNDAVALERAMIEGYLQWLEEAAPDAGLHVIAPETTLSAELSGQVAGDQVDVRVMAKLDVRMARDNDNVRMFVDHKTVGDFTSPRKTLHMDPQMLEYHLLEWLNTPEGEARCDGALYNMLRKVKRSSTAKPPFYDRVEVHHNEIELSNYRLRLLGAARDIQRAARELDAGGDPMSVVYPNPTRNCSWDCDFFPVCPMFDDGSRAEDALAALYVQTDPNARYSEESSI
jgi:transcriptional regulator with XRE-family HTH domain